ncbi:MAG: PorV/PorQ family protein [bacterium]
MQRCNLPLNRNNWILATTASLILLFCPMSFGQESRGAAGTFLRMGVGARALSLGGAFTGLANGPSATYWNPAGLHQIQKLQFEFMNMNLPFDRTFNFFTGVMPVKNYFSVGVSWIGLKVDNIEGRSFNSSTPENIFSNSQNAFLISVSKNINSMIAVGGNFKIIRNDLADQSATGMGFDASLLVNFNNQIRLGLLLQDIGTDFRWDRNYTEGVPLNLRVGASWRAHELVTVVADVSKTAGLSPVLHLGSEVRPISMLPIRVGLNDKQFTGGAGFVLPLSEHTLEINYGYASDKVFDDAVHRISLVFSLDHTTGRFKKKKSKPVWQTNSVVEKNSYDKLKKMAQVTASTLNVRSGPGKNFRIVTKVQRGQKFELLQENGKWRKIRLGSGSTGWVHENYLKIVYE